MAFEMDPGFGHWLAGFVDGEGCFAIVSQKRTGLPDLKEQARAV